MKYPGEAPQYDVANVVLLTSMHIDLYVYKEHVTRKHMIIASFALSKIKKRFKEF